MASGGNNMHVTSKVGKSAEVVVHLPFTPRRVVMAVASGGAIEHGIKTSDMPTDEYLSTSTGVDAGVTIGDQRITLANGADINVAAGVISITAWD